MVLLSLTSLFQFQKTIYYLDSWFFCSWVSGILFKLHTMTGTLLFLMSCFVYVRELLGDHIHCITDGADATGSLVMFFVKFVKALISICGGCVPVVSLLTNGKWFIMTALWLPICIHCIPFIANLLALWVIPNKKFVITSQPHYKNLVNIWSFFPCWLINCYFPITALSDVD